MILNKFKKFNVDNLETNVELKDFLTRVYSYKVEYELMIKRQEKETSKELNRLFLVDDNIITTIYENINIILYFAENDIKYLEEDFIKYKHQYSKVLDLLDSYGSIESIISDKKELYSINASLKELASSYQWKKRSYEDIFENSVTFVTEFDNVDFIDLKINEEKKDEILDIIMAQLSSYGYDYDNFNAMNNHLIEISKKFKNLRINFDILNKNKSKKYSDILGKNIN